MSNAEAMLKPGRSKRVLKQSESEVDNNGKAANASQFDPVPATSTTTCRVCGECKPNAEFFRNKKAKTGLDSRCKTCTMEYQRRWRLANSESARGSERNAKFKKTYGITVKEYDALLDAQDGRCALCDRLPTERRRLGVDHDHLSGRIRGLLCTSCNTGIGALGDSLAGLRRAIAYLEGKPSTGMAERLAARMAARQLERLDELSLIGHPTSFDPETRSVVETALRLAARIVLEQAA